MIDQRDITGLILAGGRGQRMGGSDKGLQNFNGLPLALRIMQRLQVGVGPLMVNANRNIAAYESFGVPVWPDAQTDYAGPLAGFLTGLEHCETPFLVTTPCDTPLLPLDLVPRLAAALEAKSADIAMAAAPEVQPDGHSQLYSQPVFCLLRAQLLESLRKFTSAGGRKISDWTALHLCVRVPFDLPDDDPHAFLNANTLIELRQLEGMT